MDTFSQFRKASRFRVLPLMMIPVFLGAIGAYAWDGIFHPGLFLVTLLGAGAIHLYSNMINDLWDFRSGADSVQKETAGTIATNSGFLTAGTISERKFAGWTWGLFYLALVCGIILSYTSGWMVLVYAGLGSMLAYFYVAPPLQFGYRGKGYSEVAILLSFGVLPVLGSYFVQTSHFSLDALLASFPVGLLTTLILFNHHFLHWQADKLAGKNTLVVVLGEKRAIRFSIGLLSLCYAALIAAVLFGSLPLYALIALLPAVAAVNVYRSLKDHNPSQAYLPLMGVSLQMAVRSGLGMIISLLIQGFCRFY
jgi:1,4-dihydroxy-2-naphthoate octaprenyltransferase